MKGSKTRQTQEKKYNLEIIQMIMMIILVMISDLWQQLTRI